MSEPNKHWWVDVGKQALSFLIGVVVAAFVLGRGIQKINDVYNWKKEIAPKIERMDTTGTLSFDLFHKQYEKDQHRIDDHFKTLDVEVKDLNKKVDP